jgi:hypothetical protein
MELAKNIEVQLVGTVLHIAVDLAQNQGPSKSGNTVVCAKTGGYLRIPGTRGLLSLAVYDKPAAPAV